MAAAIARHLVSQSALANRMNIRVYSACIKAQADNPEVEMLLAESGIELNAGLSYVLAPALYGQLDWLITLGRPDDEYAPELHNRVPAIHWSLDIPAATESTGNWTKNDYRRIRDLLNGRIKEFFTGLANNQELLDKPPEFTGKDFEVVRQQTCYKGFFELQELTLKHALFEGGYSPEFKRELFVRGPVVVVLLYDPRKDSVVVIEQFRVGCMQDERSPWLLELVAGIVDKGETPEQVARREALEEAGCAIQQLELVYKYWISPGGNDEFVHFYCACVDSDGVGGVHGLDHENEDIRVHLVPVHVAWQAVETGIINNAATIIGLQWLQLNKASLRQRWC